MHAQLNSNAVSGAIQMSTRQLMQSQYRSVRKGCQIASIPGFRLRVMRLASSDAWLTKPGGTAKMYRSSPKSEKQHDRRFPGGSIAQ